MIDELAPVAAEGKLYGAANGFVNDQVERKKQYGERMFVSPKQVAWLERLHEEFVGTAEPAEPKGVDEHFGRVQSPDNDVDDQDRPRGPRKAGVLRGSWCNR
jgi:hypothetical protein